MAKILLTVVLVVGILSLLYYVTEEIKKRSLPTKDYVDLKRYLGRWYEIARKPFMPEDHLYCIKADYSLLENNVIGVVNSGRKDGPKGELK